jgi:hypothetical protein
VLQTLEVVWLYDRTSDPPKPRMHVCLSYPDGWLLRINTRNNFRPAVAIDRSRNSWLDHDSFVECNLQEWDEFALDDDIRSLQNPVGFLHPEFKAPILTALLGLPYVRRGDKVRLTQLLS